MGAWRRGEHPKKPAAPKQQSLTAAEKEWLAQDKFCRGCKYYGHLARSGALGMRCCDYTYMTGRIQQKPPRECDKKEAGRRAHPWEGK